MKKEIKDIMNSVLGEMEAVFTSYAFNQSLKARGIETSNHTNRSFLLAHCKPHGTNKTWAKKAQRVSIADKLLPNRNVAVVSENKQLSIPIGECHCTLEQKIVALKAEGYKIFKTIEI